MVRPLKSLNMSNMLLEVKNLDVSLDGEKILGQLFFQIKQSEFLNIS